MRRVLPLFALLVVASPAAAATVTLTETSPPATYHPAGRAVDIIGIAPGMHTDAVHTILQQAFGAVAVQQDNFGLSNNGISVSTQNYVMQMIARQDSDEVSVWFGTPTTGNAVVEVARQTSFVNPASAPTLADARKQLADKYGSPGFEGPALGSGEVQLMAWSYHGDKPAECTGSSCRTGATDGLNVGDMASYERAVHRGHDLTIVAMLLTGLGDATRVSSVVITVSDTATKLHTLEDAIKQMKAAARPAGKPTASRSVR